MSKDYYNILGVDKSASAAEIKKAYHKKAHEFHPDKAGGDEAKFKEVNEAYQVLGNEQKRAQYDQFGTAEPFDRGGQGFGGFGGGGFSQGGFNVDMEDLGDIFGGIGDIFGFGSRGGGAPRARRGSDIQTIMPIELEEAVFGAEKEVRLQKRVKCDKCNGNGAEPGTKIETCPVCKGTGRTTRVQRTILGNVQMQSTCQECGGEGKTYAQKCSQCGGTGRKLDAGTLKVKIPAGIDHGETIRLAGQGEAGEKGAPAGDLYIKITLNDHPKFRREGYDIFSRTKITFTQAALGDKIDVETIEGPVKLKIPAGTQSGTTFKLRGKGVTRLRGRGRGDHNVKVVIETPASLTKKQKDALKDLNI